jgi:leukotriene-A4 hydrolase
MKKLTRQSSLPAQAKTGVLYQLSMAAPALRSHSYSNLDEVTFTHLHWVVALDFAAQQLKGYAEYTVHHASTSSSRSVVILDTHHLSVSKAYADGKETAFTLADKEHPVFGRALTVSVPSHATKVRVDYATSAASSGLQWLNKELTAGKTHPYLFTQCQAIHARTIVPCPDTPACKFTYSATVTVPDWCTCLMSAIADPQGRKNHNSVDSTYQVSFQQQVPIPSYLLAVVAGKLESVDLGPRSRVWAEPAVVTKAAHEFAQTEAFLQHAEEITGQEYVWKRYDLVCLPPSFPYGGMENPCLTFVTPTLLAGDRSLADVVAHEISHSWTGNLVTNRSWTDFWLNEGWTMWLERKIQTRIAQDPKAYDLKAAMGLRDLVESVEEFGPTHPYTALVPNTDGIDPDEVFSSIPYEKGFNFLHYLSTVVGGHDVFDKFAQAYIQEFKFKTVTSGEFRAFFETYFADKQEALRQVDWEAWYHSPGMPPVANKFDTTLTEQATTLGEQMAASSDPETWTSVTKNVLKKWPASLWILLLDTLLLKQQDAVFTPTHLDAIDAFTHHHLTTTHNSELRFRWFTLSLRSGDLRLLDKTVEMLKEQGRMKFVRPLFRDLCTALGAAQAEAIFADCKHLYHPIAAKMIQRDIENSIAKAKGKKVKFASPTTPSAVAQWLGVSDEVVQYATVAAAVAVVALVVVSRRR